MIKERAVQSVSQSSEKIQNRLERIRQLQKRVEEHSILVRTEYQTRATNNLEALSLTEEINHQKLSRLLDDLQRPIDRMESRLREWQDNLQADKRIEILNWLSTIPYRKHHIEAHKKILQGTGGWFLDDDRMLQWRRSSLSSILWLHGIPGSGKTKLTSVGHR